MQSALEIIFKFNVIAILYTYIGYPLFLYFVGMMFSKKVDRSFYQPRVTFLITAYNEERALAAKLENTLKLDYPNDKLEIIVASDGSTDKTDEIAKGFAKRGVKLFRQEGRVGKTMTQNNAVDSATGDVIVFSDATTAYDENVLAELLPNFADPSIGCVAGRLIYVDAANSDVGYGTKNYWNYETFLRENESRVCSLIGVSGCLYAVRKSAYRSMYREACSDFVICTLIYSQGMRSIYEPKAICREETNREAEKELRMRIRVISQTFNDLWRNRSMMNPFQSGFFAIELFSHKVLRYAIPVFLFLLFTTSAILAISSVSYSVVFFGQFLFYFIALIGWILEKKGKKIAFLAIPHYFVLTNLASVLGFMAFLKGERFARWEPIRETDAGQSSK